MADGVIATAALYLGTGASDSEIRELHKRLAGRIPLLWLWLLLAAYFLILCAGAVLVVTR